jgi:hypothetical protein
MKRQKYTIELSTLEHEFLLMLLSVEQDFDSESKHCPREAELCDDTLAQLRAMRRVSAEEG